ncbi:TRAP dicarboxylate subunit, putative [Babesia ovata]|uniref:TRAP dicarboxylate subunit, putative n=1 Tax=Babesia ovata TaxID=189622 RepID=A0A2H6KGI8_9APIC|nr:TRAP dicarboxylate subunit, putative [Babesia ovata]GBE62108.1 TRAP dicarboxylate subunit, putative [Babesia ovata]
MRGTEEIIAQRILRTNFPLRITVKLLRELRSLISVVSWGVSRCYLSRHGAMECWIMCDPMSEFGGDSITKDSSDDGVIVDSVPELAPVVELSPDRTESDTLKEEPLLWSRLSGVELLLYTLK